MSAFGLPTHCSCYNCCICPCVCPLKLTIDCFACCVGCCPCLCGPCLKPCFNCCPNPTALYQAGEDAAAPVAAAPRAMQMNRVPTTNTKFFVL